MSIRAIVLAKTSLRKYISPTANERVWKAMSAFSGSVREISGMKKRIWFRFIKAQSGPDDIWNQHCSTEKIMRVIVTALPTTVSASETELEVLVLERGTKY